MFVIRPFLLLTIGDRSQILTSECKIHRADFIDFMSFLSSNLMEEISQLPEELTLHKK